MRTSTRGAHFLMREEGCVLHAYNDPVGYCTVGVGHLLHESRCTLTDLRRWEHMTQQQAIALLFNDLLRYEGTVSQAIRVAMHQCEYDAFVSLTYNIGQGGFLDSSLARAMNRGPSGRAELHADFDKWSLAGGRPILYGRREREWRMFSLGDYNDGLPFAKDPGPPKPPPDPKIPPSPIPDWAWKWVEWKLGRGVYKGHAGDMRLRPKDAPRVIPPWGWIFIKRFTG